MQKSSLMLSKKAVLEYQQIYKKEYGEEITYQEALKQATRLLMLFKAIYRPIKRENYNEKQTTQQ